jgi:Zn-finger nucleic acid-binding protein
MHCPRCTQPLLPSPFVEAGGLQVEGLRCSGCGGRWFAPAALSRLQETVEVRLWEVRRVPDAEAQQRAMSCPACGGPAPMRKVVAERDAHVVMDVCPRCEGTWLDAGELEALREEGLAPALWSALRWVART